MTKTVKAQSDTIFEEEHGQLAVPDSAMTTVRQVVPGVVLHAGAGMPVTRMRLAQPTSSEGTPGHFVASDGSGEREDLTIVPVRVQAVQTLWPEGGFQRGRRPECFSPDGVRAAEFFPDGTHPLYAGNLCAECPMHVSQPWKLEQGTRFCSPGYDILGLSLETFEVISLRLTGTSAKLANVLGRPGIFARQQVQLFAKRQVTEKGSWFQMFAKPLGPVSEEELRAVEVALSSFQPQAEVA
jgi:hypothetical protein